MYDEVDYPLGRYDEQYIAVTPSYSVHYRDIGVFGT